MRRVSAPLFLVAVLIPALVRASELLVETEMRTLYDDNPGNVSTDANQEGDTALRGDLRLRVNSDETGRFRGWLAYNPRYERFFDLDELNGWTHRADGEFEYLFSGRTTLSGAGQFAHTTTSRLDEEDFGTPDVTNGDEAIDRGEFSLALAHRWAPRWASEFSLNYEFDRYERHERSDFDSAGGVATLHYALSPRHTLGGGLALTFQNLEGTGSEDDRSTRFVGAFGSWGFIVNPRWSLNVQAGPVFIDADEADGPGALVLVDPLVPRWRTAQGEVQVLDAYTCPSLSEGVTHSRGLSTFFLADQCEVAGPRLPQGLGSLGPSSVQLLTNPQDFDEDSDSTTVFADITLARRGERTRWELTLQRTTGSNFGGSTSTVDSIARTRFFWDPSERWRFSLAATYTKQESATESSQIVEVVSPLGELQPGSSLPEVAVRTGELRVVQIDDAVDVETYALHFRARRRFTRHLSAFVSLDYRRQNNHGDFFGTGRETERFRAGIGLTYGFDPIPL